ncbi:hypothetical protein CDV36_004136 [Fusarium kuroshium]|uniref:Oxidoreductase n=1 Tax=Fusarium kuroshium TaxID=2010991 RepID=A0A3M2SF77_9HYPO|nr:hypothetical protein CDV36_004136 [Fusarium kuroshium]
MTFHPDLLPDLTGKVYIVTGGTSGIGYNTVARLAQHGAHVYLCARSQAKGEKAVSEIKKRYPQANISILEMDHLSLPAVVSAAKFFLSKETVLHGLVNNAGIMATPFEMTKDGYEAQWQTNYLAHWVFTSYLVPLLLNTSKGLPSGTVRIVNLSSAGHHQAPKGGIIFADTSLPNESALTRYGQSKLGNVLHAKTLHKMYGPGSPSSKAGEGEIWTSIVHPGLVESHLGDRAEFPPLMRQFFAVFGALGGRVDGDKGAWTSLFCVAGPQMKESQSGTYFQRIAEAGWESRLAKDEMLAEKLEEWTKEEMKKGGWVGL